MMLDTNNMVSMTEATQNFSKAERMVDQNGQVVILRNNDFALAEQQMALDEDVRNISRRLIAKNRKAYEDLAK